MEQTQKYIKVLNWGYGGFAPMTLSPDYKASLEQAQQRLSLLDDLDYNALLDEAIGKGKDYLTRYIKTNNTFEYGLHFMRDGKTLLDAIPTMFKCFKDGADGFRADGLWTDEQWREYRVALSQIEKGFEDRLKQFAAAYDYNIISDNQKQTATEQQNDLQYYCHKAIEKGYLEKTLTGYKRKGWTKAQLAYFLGHFLNQDGTFPDKDYCPMFNESRLSKALTQLADNKNGNGKPKGYNNIDELLKM